MPVLHLTDVVRVAAAIQDAARIQGIAPVSTSDSDATEMADSEACKNEAMALITKARSVQSVLQVLSSTFPDCAGYLHNRHGSVVLDLKAESGVQDLLYFMLKPMIPDLVPEQPVAGYTRQYTIQDFRSCELRLIIEAKRVRDKSHGRSIKAELNDDIGEYKADTSCDHLMFFVYDPDTFIESPSGLTKSVQGTHMHNGRSMQVYCLVQR